MPWMESDYDLNTCDFESEWGDGTGNWPITRHRRQQFTSTVLYVFRGAWIELGP